MSYNVNVGLSCKILLIDFIGGQLMKKFLMALMGASIFVLGACGGGAADPAPAEDPAEAPVEEAPADDAEAVAGTYDAAAAEALYQKSCAGCHGGDLGGQGSFPALAGTNLTVDEIVHIIEQGQGAMPPNLATGEEAQNLAAWLADQ